MRIDVNIRDRNLQFDISRGSMALRCRSFSKKTLKRSTCTVLIRIIITFGNQIFLQFI